VLGKARDRTQEQSGQVQLLATNSKRTADYLKNAS